MNKPKKTLAIGCVSVSVFEREFEKEYNGVMKVVKSHNYAISKSYFDKKEEKWKYTTFLSGQDAMIAASLMQRLVIMTEQRTFQAEDIAPLESNQAPLQPINEAPGETPF